MTGEDINIMDYCKKPGRRTHVPEVLPVWRLGDYAGSVLCRLSNSFRMKYRMKPGLYGIGQPDGNSEVFASANYKLSFDILRKSLKGLNAWILVLDTKGVNVWCAAGKGTFGTDELVRMIKEAELGSFLSHRRIIVPQLGAVGINAVEVLRRSGFKVFFGPVYAKDIKDYIYSGKKKTPVMKLIEFSIKDRLVLSPMEMIPAFRKFAIFAVIVLLFFGLQPSGIIFKNAWDYGNRFIELGLASIIAGSFITPVFLPFIPFRSFAVKGWLVGFVFVAAILFFWGMPSGAEVLLFVSEILFFPMAASYLALQFTGSTTFTNMSGVKKELSFAIPVYLISAAVSVILLLIYKVIIMVP